jgi:hypothetical protein
VLLTGSNLLAIREPNITPNKAADPHASIILSIIADTLFSLGLLHVKAAPKSKGITTLPQRRKALVTAQRMENK